MNRRLEELGAILKNSGIDGGGTAASLDAWYERHYLKNATEEYWRGHRRGLKDAAAAEVEAETERRRCDDIAGLDSTRRQNLEAQARAGGGQGGES